MTKDKLWLNQILFVMQTFIHHSQLNRRIWIISIRPSIIWCLVPNRKNKKAWFTRESSYFSQANFISLLLMTHFDLSSPASSTSESSNMFQCCVISGEFICENFSREKSIEARPIKSTSFSRQISIAVRSDFTEVREARESWESCNFPQPSIILSHHDEGEGNSSFCFF